SYVHYLLCVILFFFFSSRRRHTRSYGDWSSDMCSSDLPASAGTTAQSAPDNAAADPGGSDAAQGSNEPVTDASDAATEAKPEDRSEERRVGKECRSRWTAYYEKKKAHR